MARRRANSEGTLTQRKDGRWEAQLSLPDGKRRSFYGKSKQDALKKMQAAQRQVADSKPLPPERLTVGTWLETWLRDTVPLKCRPRTAHRYGEIVRLHLVPRLGRIRLRELTASDVDRAMREALAAGQSPRSVAQHRAVLRAALYVAMKGDKVGRNVAPLSSAIHVTEEEREALTPTTARAILQAVRGDRLEVLYALMLAVGLRSGEARGLRWTDLDLDAATLAVRRNLQRVDGEWRFLEPKTARSRRSIRLPSAVVSALRTHHIHQLEERLKAGSLWEGQKWGGLVFPNEVGGPLDASTAVQHFQRLLKKAGLPAMRVHDLRHGAATIMAALGVSPRVAMEVLGHSSIATTMNIYSHVAPEQQVEAMARVDKAIWGA